MHPIQSVELSTLSQSGQPVLPLQSILRGHPVQLVQRRAPSQSVQPTLVFSQSAMSAARSGADVICVLFGFNYMIFAGNPAVTEGKLWCRDVRFDRGLVGGR